MEYKTEPPKLTDDQGNDILADGTNYENLNPSK